MSSPGGSVGVSVAIELVSFFAESSAVPLPFAITMNPSPQIAPSPIERRGLRSDLPYQAVEIYLETLKRRKTLRLVALSDDNGLLLAGNGRRHDLELLAMWGVLDSDEQARYRSEIDSLCRGAHLSSCRFQVDQALLSLTAIDAADSTVQALEADVKRILGMIDGGPPAAN